MHALQQLCTRFLRSFFKVILREITEWRNKQTSYPTYPSSALFPYISFPSMSQCTHYLNCQTCNTWRHYKYCKEISVYSPCLNNLCLCFKTVLFSSLSSFSATRPGGSCLSSVPWQRTSSICLRWWIRNDILDVKTSAQWRH